jgi:hypothetical protein
MTHTPGPWTARQNPEPESFLRHSFFIDGGEPQRAPVAEVRHYYDGEGRANARLIAAAPELLEALENIDANLTGKDCLAQRVEDSIRRARAAIAKARG